MFDTKLVFYLFSDIISTIEVLMKECNKEIIDHCKTLIDKAPEVSGTVDPCLIEG